MTLETAQPRNLPLYARHGFAVTRELAPPSPGGPVVTSLEIARLVRQASNDGMVIEIQAEALCASGCTFVLASGTPGHRFITKNALYLVHPIQGVSMFSRVCVDRKGVHEDDYDPDAKPSTSDVARDKQDETAKKKSEQEKVIDALYDAMEDQYMEYSGQSLETVRRWMECGRSQAGLGQLAVDLRLADQVRG